MTNSNSRFKDIFLSNTVDDNADFIPLITDEDEVSMDGIEIPDTLPILPLKNTVLFPGVILPISVGREKSVKLIQEVNRKGKILGAITQKDAEIEEPAFKDLYKTGTVAQIIKILEMPDGSTSVIIQGKKRFKLQKLIQEDPYFTANVKPLEEVKPIRKNREYEAIVGSLKDLSIKIIQLSSNIPPETSFAVKNIDSSSFLINFICSNSNLNAAEKQKLLEVNELKKRGTLLLQYLSREVQKLELQNDIQSKVKKDLDKQQREYMLHQQIKTIQDELGGSPIEQEVEDLRKQAAKKKWSKQVADIFEKELKKLQRLNPATGEYSIHSNYLRTMLDLPWDKTTKDNFDLDRAQKTLDKDHYGLEKVKERIIEHLAVLKLKNDMKSPILCFLGPPGVGKTSLGKSIAKALNRNYVRMSLGGLHDESEIRGHRKTYIGAMPGRILQNIKKAKSSNPVFMLDEVDKIGKSFHGDPASALLEVLDPEQNNAFYDNYIEFEYDLSKVLFITTANTSSTIHPALLDRMETIDISGYIVEEKTEIAKRHLIPKQLKEHGLKRNQLSIAKNAIEEIIEHYTRESGVRELDKTIAKVVRRIAKKIAVDEEVKRSITKTDISEILGSPKYLKEKNIDNDYIGVVTGLAWTNNGGEILFVETSLSKGKGKLTLTGNLGDVMKESATLALEYIKAHAEALNIKINQFDENNVHVHVPEGAIPKDGPSAGITMITSIASAFTKRRVKKNLAMTGEITLRGKILPVGGIKEKILAAKRANINEIILSEENKKDVDEIKDIYIKGLKFYYVRTIMDALNIALV